MRAAQVASEVQLVNIGAIGNSKAWAMLTARALQYDQVGGRGHATLTTSDVAGMLAGLERAPYLCGLFVEAGYWDCLVPLERHLWRAIVDLATDRRWNLPKGPGPCRPLGHLALFELVGPSTPCHICKGEGSTADEHTTTRTACERCNGRGKLPLTPFSRADLIGINPPDWSKRWEARYQDVFQIPLTWLDEANRHLRRQLRKAREVAA